MRKPLRKAKLTPAMRADIEATVRAARLLVPNMDSDESIFFARELEHVKAAAFDIKRPQLKHRDLIPMSTDAGAGAESITYRQHRGVGIARLVADFGDDLPRAEAKAKEFTSPVKSIAMSYAYSIQELAAASKANKPLNAMRASSALRGHLELENKIAWFGDADAGLPGLLTNPNISTVVLPADGIGGQTTFASKTADQILRDLNNMATSVHDISVGTESPDIMLLPILQLNVIFTLRIPDTDISVGRWFLENSPHIQSIDWLNELKGTGGGGTDQMLVYRRSPENLTFEVPEDFRSMPAQAHNLEFMVPTHSRVGGVIVYYPLAIALAEGI